MLDLQINKNLHTDEARIESHVASDIYRLPAKRKHPRQCHFIGRVRGYSGSKVALTNCDGLVSDELFYNYKDALWLPEPYYLSQGTQQKTNTTFESTQLSFNQ